MKKMLHRQQLQNYLDQLLLTKQFEDYCPNGLQVEGKAEIKIIVSGVTACQALLDRAVELKADAILVHHGYFWQGETPTIVGIKQKRIKTLLQNNINLFAYHLPLDAQLVYGNNAQLAKLLTINNPQPLAQQGTERIIFQGRLNKPMSGDMFKTYVDQQLQTQTLHIASEIAVKQIDSIVFCSGAAQKYIDYAIAVGADAYLTGEVSEATVHIARENGIHFFAAGHHATERYGIKAIGEHLAEEFGLQHYFIDIANPA